MFSRKLIAIPAIALTAGISLAACGTSQAPAGHPATVHTSSRPAATAPQSAPATAIPVLTPGHSATFTIRPYAGGTATSLTWTMGAHVATLPDTNKPGYESAGFQVTIRNNGPASTEGSPDYGSSLTWTGMDGRADDTPAQQAAAAYPDQIGLTGTNITLQSALPPGGYVSGYLEWEVPAAPGYVTLQSGSADAAGTVYPVMRINLR